MIAIGLSHLTVWVVRSRADWTAGSWRTCAKFGFDAIAACVFQSINGFGSTAFVERRPQFIHLTITAQLYFRIITF